ncbi:potassium channel family protein [Mycobacterium sp. IDR2000157661]|uniref:potassium channel family protein n=1 Tax=Mycobacterium sp. IDR2000157661 TaxID=2867005 RepID=UPI001EEA0B1B|nr:NAD-binding protein [Mycobacterium sp. IDR2000157661]ULE33461.1 NAD-binding protein [Mycobacterium sp. IDR2000157661]
MISPRSLRLTIIEFRWALLGVAALAAFGLGWVGYTEYLYELYAEGAVKHPPQATDIAYNTLKLFLMGSPGTTGLPITLEIARILAPLVSGYAALSGLVLLFHDRFQQLRVPLMRGHVVICGLGYVGSLFGDRLRRAGYQVVVVELDPANPFLTACRSWRCPIFLGDARLEATLREAGLHRAAQLLALCPDDAVNAEIVAVARRIVTGRRRGQLRCLARIDNSELCRLLRVQEVNSNDGAQSSLDFFNIDEISARLCLDDFPITAGTNGSPHVLVSRLDAMGTWLVKHAAWGWFTDRTDETPLWVTVVDDQARDRVQGLLDQYPALESVCRFNESSMSVRDLARLDTMQADTGAPPVTRAYVSAYRDEDAIEALLRLRHELDPTVPFVVALSRTDGVARLFTDVITSGELTNVSVFPALERTCTAELAAGGSFERIAVAIHDRWRAGQLAVGNDAPPWADLDESRRESSRAQARDMPFKLRSIGCTIAPLHDIRAPAFEFTDEEFEALAIAEHKRWVTERLESGWRLGSKDPERKTSPYLVPFDELPDDIAELDRDAVRQIPDALALVDLKAIRSGASGRRAGQPTLIGDDR